MIEIQNIRNVDANDIVNLLLDERQQPFHIYFFKDGLLFFSSRETIADDYLRLTYTGYRLNKVSDKIDYEIVYPQDDESVLFKIDSKNIELLAKTLLELSYLYSNSSEEEHDYREDLYQYLDDLESGKETLVCPEFFEIYQEYSKPEENEDGEDETEEE